MSKARKGDDSQTHLRILLAELERAEDVLRRLRIQVLAMPAATNEATSPNTTITGISQDKFKCAPYVAVSRGRLLDGPKGPVMNGRIIRGAERTVLAHLLLHESIHTMEVITYQAKNGSGTIFDRKRHAETTIARLKRAIALLGLAIEKKGRDRHSMEWVLRREDGLSVAFSIDLAVGMAECAARELAQGTPACAFLKAIQARECDGCVQMAHEVLCRAAAMVAPDDIKDAKPLEQSVFFLRNRLDQLNRGLQICEGSFAYADDDVVRADLEFYAKQFRAEQERLETMIADMTTRFGPFDREPPWDCVANEAIRGLRTLNLTFEQARTHPTYAAVLGHPCVDALRNKTGHAVRAAKQEERAKLRAWINDEVLRRVLDPNVPPNIRVICKAVKHEIPAMLDPDPDRRSSEARDAKKLENAEDAIFKAHGRRASTEVPEDVVELARLMGCTVERVRDIVAWKKTHGSWRLEAAEREERKNRKRLSGDSDDDDADEDADDKGDDDADDDGWYGVCVR